MSVRPWWNHSPEWTEVRGGMELLSGHHAFIAHPEHLRRDPLFFDSGTRALERYVGDILCIFHETGTASFQCPEALGVLPIYSSNKCDDLERISKA